ncbi:vacuolar protein sorting-associated protein 45 (VPS45) [Vairimorpha necatrix]|uniref:Vacuolar protein sorting-associated protein 45 (VPS45) n=1 Tax=Vairimorpha necatrix TaxID=6039 RepID=A0AAX4JCT4_9MICR
MIQKISKILTASSGVKCLLFDTYTKSNLSSLIPHSHFLEYDYFLFDNIENTRTKININCVCVINISSFKNLIKEISDPSYKSYTVLFTNYLDPYLMNLLAKNDVYGVIEDIQEIYMDFNKQDDNMYTVQKLEDFIYSLGTRPTIYSKIGSNSKMLDNTYDKFIREDGGRVFIIDRSYDHITPLIIDWHYQSMIKRYCEYDDCIVKIQGIKYNIQDDFFKDNKFRNISEVSSNLETLVKELDIKKRSKKVNIKEIEEINRLNEVVSKHMKIYNHIIRNIEEKRRISEEQMNILKNNKYTYKYEKIFKDGNKGTVGDNQDEQNYIQDKQNHHNHQNHILDKDIVNLKNVLKYNKYKYDIKKNEDIKLAYLPPIRKIVKNILKNNLKDWELVQERNNKDKYTVFYFRGGVTYTEYRFIMELYDYQENVYIISERVI